MLGSRAGSDPAVTFGEEAVRHELRDLVGRAVGDTLSALLEEEADDLIKAESRERTADRKAYRVGRYKCGLATTSDQVTLEMPKLKGLRFTAAIIDCYKRQEASVKESMIEILWGASVSAEPSRTSTRRPSGP